MAEAPTPAELAIYDEISRLALRLWDLSKDMSGWNTDPKMFSIMLYKRLWSNHRGFTVLWNERLSLEADIVLRAGIEAAICIAANHRMGKDFIQLLRQDAAHTVQGQVKLFRNSGDLELVRDGEEMLRSLQSHFEPGAKAERLDWKALAVLGQVPQLYEFHRMLSGVSAHVTGLSLLRSVAGEGDEELQRLTQKTHLMMMAGTTLQASMIHAAVIGDTPCVESASGLIEKLNVISMVWPDGGGD